MIHPDRSVHLATESAVIKVHLLFSSTVDFLRSVSVVHDIRVFENFLIFNFIIEPLCRLFDTLDTARNNFRTRTEPRLNSEYLCSRTLSSIIHLYAQCSHVLHHNNSTIHIVSISVLDSRGLYNPHLVSSFIHHRGTYHHMPWQTSQYCERYPRCNSMRNITQK